MGLEITTTLSRHFFTSCNENPINSNYTQRLNDAIQRFEGSSEFQAITAAVGSDGRVTAEEKAFKNWLKNDPTNCNGPSDGSRVPVEIRAQAPATAPNTDLTEKVAIGLVVAAVAAALLFSPTRSSGVKTAMAGAALLIGIKAAA